MSSATSCSFWERHQFHPSKLESFFTSKALFRGKMARPSPAQFIDAALYSTGSPYALSYKYHEHKWIIRDHLLALLRDFPSLAPTTDTFFHNDGTMATLFKVIGSLPISSSHYPIPLTIWLHQCYPFHKPLVFVTTTPATPILRRHPFVDPSGATTSPYLETWNSDSNLVDLARNLTNIFRHHPPFPNSPVSYSSGLSHASKREAIDILVGSLHYDVITLQAQVNKDIEELTNLQVDLRRRREVASELVSILEVERSQLKENVEKMHVEADVLQNWLKVNGQRIIIDHDEDDLEEVFEVVGNKSKKLLEHSAEDLSIEDLMYCLDSALESGLLDLADYLKQIRKVSKEQFFHRTVVEKLKRSYPF